MTTTYKKDAALKKMYVTRAFEGSLRDVWDAWTKSEILDQWWAPLPWKAETKRQDFRDGGEWLYSMNGPEGEKHWAIATYRHISPMSSFEVTDAFCDENGKLNNDVPQMQWHTAFQSSNGRTNVDVEITFASEGDMETIVKMGFQEGFAAAHENLDRYLKSKQ